jgi:hypothetical protein
MKTQERTPDPDLPYSATDWYGVCLAFLRMLELHADNRVPLCDAYEPWCAFCDAAADAINDALEECVP